MIGYPTAPQENVGVLELSVCPLAGEKVLASGIKYLLQKRHTDEYLSQESREIDEPRSLSENVKLDFCHTIYSILL